MAQARSSYRYVLRAIRETFGSDIVAVKKGRNAARNEFVKNATVKDEAAVKQLVADALDAADFLRGSIVQAKLNNTGRYEMKLQTKDSDIKNLDLQPANAGASKHGGGCC